MATFDMWCVIGAGLLPAVAEKMVETTKLPMPLTLDGLEVGTVIRLEARGTEVHAFASISDPVVAAKIRRGLGGSIGFGARAQAIDPMCPTAECRGMCAPEAHGGP